MIMNNSTFDRSSLRLPATLLLAGQLLYVVITLIHTGGDANNHPAIFSAYASSGDWTAVHLGQFASIAILLAGLFALFFILDAHDAIAKWAGRFGAGLAVAALTLYGALQAVDGVANKLADVAWKSAPYNEQAARFASAEVVRWIEWGMRSYQAFTMGLAVLLFAVAVLRTSWIPKPIAFLMWFTGLIYLVQGWVVGSEGFSQTMSVAIVLTEILSAVWMIWLVVIAWRRKEPASKLSIHRVLWIGGILIGILGVYTYTTSLMKPSIKDVPSNLDYSTTRLSDKGLFNVSYTVSIGAIPVNQIHQWTLHVESADGKPVEDATINVDGDMPQHGHGLPTQPRVTKNLGNGDYLVDGMKFQMGGWWLMDFTITAGGQADTVHFNLMLK
jgi:hypothetical protein